MVRAIMIVEIAGRPAEHLKNALEAHIGVLNKVNDISVHSIKLSEPRLINQSVGSGKSEVGSGEEMFTAFAEADFECQSFARLSETMFDFMPSSVEVIEPTNVSLSMHEATDLLNNISGRMHRYDEIAKIAGERLRQAGVQFQNMQKVLAERDAEILKLKNGGKVKKKVAKKKSIKKKISKNK